MTRKFRTFSVSMFISLFAVASFVTSCISNNPITDAPEDTLVAPWELRDGTESYFQLTNVDTSGSVGVFTKRVHIQILDRSCVEIINFFDTYTPGDTHLYVLSNLTRNNNQGFDAPPDLVGKAGFIVIQNVNLGDNNLASTNDLTGMYRIVYANGWEYRSNAAGFNTDLELSLTNFPKLAYTFNFNDANGTTNADIAIAFLECDSTPAECFTAPATSFETRIFDEDENEISCPKRDACNFFGINQAYQTTFPDDAAGSQVNLCNGLDPEGSVFVVADADEVEQAEGGRIFRAGFVGLNDGGLPGGGGFGHMDVWSGVWDNMCVLTNNCPDID